MCKKIISIADKYSKEKKSKPKIACMGLSYKPNVDDIRESPAIVIVNSLKNLGYDLLIVEPNLEDINTYNLNKIDTVLINADILVWLVAHDEFKNIELSNNIIEIDLCGIRKN